MLRTGAQYLDSLRDGRQVWINGERVADVTTHPAFRPIVSLRARLYDMAHEAQHSAAMSYVDDDQRRALQPRAEAAEDAAGLARQARLCRCAAQRGRRRRGARRRRDDRRAVVAVGRQGGAGRDRSAVQPECRAPHHAGADRRSVPRVGEHRSEGRPLEAAAGAGSGHAAPRGEGDGCRHRGARRQVRNRGGLCEPGLRQADDRQLGRRQAVGLCRRVHRRHGLAGHQAYLPHRVRRPRAEPRTIRCRIGSTRWIR